MIRNRRYDYLLSVLPALDTLGSLPPMNLRSFIQQVIDCSGPVETVKTILLSSDLTQYQALLAEEIDRDRTDLAVLSLDKGEDQDVLPDFLLPDEEAGDEEDPRRAVDAVWSRYFHHAATVAKRKQSKFLRDWVAFEVGLRNELAKKRAHTLELDAEDYIVAPELADHKIDYTHAISTWSAAADPLAAQEALDKVRWNWLKENEGWYSASAREIEVYAARLMLLHTWRRIMSARQADGAVSIKT